ncbi:MAG: hypothetical protein K9L78_04855 [Victivallales bacterium]|nr:hypothetical protein [Victivallales bacterium]MCF7889432.1 hypothetical protein [Victivallales bacterium]
MDKKYNPSKLQPVAKVILELRGKDCSYRKIAEYLRTNYEINVDHSSIFAFVKVRSKKKQVIEMLEENIVNSSKENLRSKIRQNDFKEKGGIKKLEAVGKDFDWGEKLFTYDRSKPIT